MTRKSKREIERDLDDLDGSDGDETELSVVYRDAATDDYYADEDLTEPVEPDNLPGMTVVINRGVVVMGREQAEREMREILGPADDVPADDAVRVRPERFTFRIS